MPLTSMDISPLAQRLHALIPEPLRRWPGEPGDPDVRDRLADDGLVACAERVSDVDEESNRQHIVISEALAGFVTLWGCRYRTLDDDVDRAQATLVTALGGEILEPGHLALKAGTPITVAAIAHLIGWVCILEVPEDRGG